MLKSKTPSGRGGSCHRYSHPTKKSQGEAIKLAAEFTPSTMKKAECQRNTGGTRGKEKKKCASKVTSFPRRG